MADPTPGDHDFHDKLQLSVLLSSNPETKILFSMWKTLERKDRILYRVNLNITCDKKILIGISFRIQTKDFRTTT